MRVLIIDDSKSMRSILRKMMSELGFETFEAEDGSQAIQRLKEHGPMELALVDWNMPVMNGYEFIQAVRADAAYNEMKLMMVTTENSMESVTMALKAGANEFVMKPFTKDIINSKLALLGIVAS